MNVPFFKPYHTGRELTYIKDLLDNRSDLSGDGGYTKKVHAFLEERYGVEKALLTTSGTTALEMAVRLLRLSEGDEIIAPSFTFSSTINAILLSAGVKVVFADIDPETMNIDPADIRRKITPKTRALMIVHYAGIPCDMDEIMKIADEHDLRVIEDAAQAIESKYKEKYLGTFGDFGCLSFHDTKNIVCGEGGALLINSKNEQDVQSAEIIREKGTNRSMFFQGLVDKYTWVDIGSSYLPSDILAAFLYAQLEAIDTITNLRKKRYDYYYNKLSGFSDVYKFRLPYLPPNTQHNAHIFYLIMNSPEERKFVLSYLRERGIGASFHYIPLHSAPQGMRLGYTASDMPVTEEYSARLLRLPLFSEVTDEEQDYVIQTLQEACVAYKVLQKSHE